jgi:putative peptidoglycan lipid II flippase
MTLMAVLYVVHYVIRDNSFAILLITIPATVGMMVLAHPIVKVAFDSNAIYMAVGALLFYFIGLVWISVKTMLYRVYYSPSRY